MKSKRTANGFSSLIVFIPVILVIAAGLLTGIRWMRANHGFGLGSNQNNTSTNQMSQYQTRNDLPSCNGNAVLTRMPADPATYQYILPLGNVSSSGGGASHVVPADHLYFTAPPSNHASHSMIDAIATSETIPVFSPGNIRIVEVDAKTYTDNATGKTANDYSIYFTSCKDVVFYFHHITNINPVITDALSKRTGNKQCGSQPLDNFQIQSCNYFNTSINLKEGDKIGTGSFDFGMYDYRQQPAAFIDQPKATTLFAACPLDYFTDPAKTQMYKKMTNTKFNALGLPDCGSIMQDIPSTIQGNWYLPNTRNQNQGGSQNTNELAIIHVNTDPATGLIAWGGIIANSNQLRFTPTASGTINLEPSQATVVGMFYCYQGPLGQTQPNSYQQYQQTAHILIQLTANTTMKVEYGAGNCPTTPSFINPTIYIR